MLLAALVLLPAVAGGVAWAARSRGAQLGLLLATATAHAAGVAALWATPGASALSGALRADALGAVFLSLVSALFLGASLYSVAYLRHGTHDAPSGAHRYVPCLLWFLSSMTLVTVSHHLAVMWAAIEATTLASAPLIYYYRRRAALEATWKYLLICSVGIALALLGTLFLGIASSAAPGGPTGLELSALQAAAPLMARPWLEAAFVLALVGYGTKVGLAPLHTWLPDAHSQAPSPVSALLSGALLNCAFLGILRFYQVCLASGDARFARTLLVVMGFASVALAAAFLVGQRDYKRLLAYSSVENMGVVAVGLGLGGAGAFGAMLHAVNHSLCKAGLFMLAGNVLRSFGTTDAREVRGVARRMPVTGALFIAGMLAISGAPPFGPFLSEWVIFQAAAGSQRWGLGALLVLLVAIAFLGMAGALLPMIQGEDGGAGPGGRHRLPQHRLSVVVPAVLVVAVAVLGVYVPPGLDRALHEAAGALGGAP